MLEICQKNIPCCSCPNMDGCTALKKENLIKELFSQYGNYLKQYNTKQLYISVEYPGSLKSKEDIFKWLHHADEDIQKLEKYIAMLQAYKMELVARYNYLETTPTKTKYFLQRYKKYQGNVFYYIITYSVDMLNGKETETDRKTYKGTEKKQAFFDFEQLKKQYKNAIFEQDTDRKSWEK